ncbi:peptide-methionine (S)-S-oxide reductase MsrA [Vallitalea pronyensis]|uniref:Peptide methionine sulfoxide reductase MsrA n=1 Tax=Vallitalea pronyensis TaxID=1348613 RepID=A0A8J8SFI9_9FIRM|nr:peptide-methionine (S)-S-oxide reductase MsrA [Vallitalea pronyensis]QUI21641.1 peptide-methionine (S)-S-oxide reductase MsrA [Vallitalea pronyensis]
MKTIVLAGGCFWGVEAYFKGIDGVIDTKVGYANGHTDSPSYEQVKTSTTGHYEAVHVDYDEGIISLKEILDAYWLVVEPTVKDRQGPDVGSQYSTGIFYMDEEDMRDIIASRDEEQKKYAQPIVTVIEPLQCFYDAEAYHQDYLDKNPTGYCHIPLDKFRK